MADELDDVAVIDVTAEMVGERRAEWRDGYEAGIKVGTQRVLQSDALAQIAAEIKLLRSAVAILGQHVEWYRGKLEDAYHVIGNPRR